MKSDIVLASSLPSVPISAFSELEMLRALISVASVLSLACTPARAWSVLFNAVVVGGDRFVELVEGLLRLIDERAFAR